MKAILKVMNETGWIILQICDQNDEVTK